MTYKLHVSGVITGSLNCFCLACDDFFKSPQDATDHIRTAEHQKKADAVQFADKFKDEHIKKFKWGYYCEYCNVLMPTATKVNLHIAEDEHKHNKGLLLLKPVGLDVVAFNNALIEESAWHGLIEGVCSLCNAEFEDENYHKNEARHSLNLVLKPIQFGAHNAIFRPLDDTSVQCLTCNKLLAPSKMSKHLDDTEHHELYAKRRIETDCQGNEAQEHCQAIATNVTKVMETDDEINNPKVDNDDIEMNKEKNKTNNEKSTTNDKSKIIEFIAVFQSKGININLETETAFCRKCSEVVTFNFMEIAKHIENHLSATAVDKDFLYSPISDQNFNQFNNSDIKTQSSNDKNNDEVSFCTLLTSSESIQTNFSTSEEDADTDSSLALQIDDWPFSQDDLGDYLKANKITFDGVNKQFYCRICKVHVPDNLRLMKEHVEGANHKRKPAKTSKQLVTQATKEFVDSAYDTRAFLYAAVIINEKYCMNRKSFYFLIKNCCTRLRCILCEVNVPLNMDTDHHVKNKQHLIKWLQVPVVISVEKEFIREVHPGLFHCGFCNLVVSGWPEMKQHLKSIDHQQSKSIWSMRLRDDLPKIQQRKRQGQLENKMHFFNTFN